MKPITDQHHQYYKQNENELTHCCLTTYLLQIVSSAIIKHRRINLQNVSCQTLFVVFTKAYRTQKNTHLQPMKRFGSDICLPTSMNIFYDSAFIS